PQVAIPRQVAGLVVDAVVAVFDTKRTRDRTGRQVEQLTGGDGVDYGLVIHGVAGMPLADLGDEFVHPLAAQEAGRVVIEYRRGVVELHIARTRRDDSQVAVVTVGTGEAAVDRP